MKPRETAVPGWRRGQGWGWIWGEHDEAGALNAITPESIAESLAGVAAGRVFDLGVTMTRRSFAASVHARSEVVSYRTPRGLQRQPDLAFSKDPEGVGFNTTMVILSDHAGTQIDGLCHATFGPDQRWYNGHTFDDWAGDFGPERAGAEGIRPIIVNAVLIDVAGHRAVEALEPSFAIGPDLLAAALESQDVDIAPGEAALVSNRCSALPGRIPYGPGGLR